MDFVKARPPRANIRVPSMPPWRTSATSVVPAADVDEQRAGLADLLRAEDARHGVRLGDDLQQLEVQLAGHGLERAEVHQRGERVEDADLDVPALEPDRVGEGVAVDRGAHDGAVDEAHVHVRAGPSPR